MAIVVYAQLTVRAPMTFALFFTADYFNDLDLAMSI